MWHVYNLVRMGDIVKTSTMRKIANESSTGSVSTQRIQMTLAVVVETIDFDPSVCSLHLKGKERGCGKFVLKSGSSASK